MKHSESLRSGLKVRRKAEVQCKEELREFRGYHSDDR